MTIREQVSQAAAEQASQASINSHTRNIHTLYATPDGRVYWSEEVSTNSWDVLAGTVTPVAHVYRTGTGSCACNCDDCQKGDDPEAWAGSCDGVGELADHFGEQVDQIPLGYFEDEAAAESGTA